VAWPTAASPQRASEVAWLSRSAARVPVRLRPIRIPISGGVGLTLYERVRSGLDSSSPGGTEVGPPSSAAIGLLVALFLANLERGAMGPPAACPQPSLRLVRWARRRDCQHCVPTVAGAWQPSSKEPKKDGSFS
jgi:hypothetical protein